MAFLSLSSQSIVVPSIAAVVLQEVPGLLHALLVVAHVVPKVATTRRHFGSTFDPPHPTSNAHPSELYLLWMAMTPFLHLLTSSAISSWKTSKLNCAVGWKMTHKNSCQDLKKSVSRSCSPWPSWSASLPPATTTRGASDRLRRRRWRWRQR